MPMSTRCLSFIAGKEKIGTGADFYSWNPILNTRAYQCYSNTEQDLDLVIASAIDAGYILADKPPSEVANFLNEIALQIEDLGDELINTAMNETGLPQARLLGERGRTCGQIRAFAALVADGSWVNASIDTAEPSRAPVPKPDIRAMLAPIGPVAVFGASNFPFAFGTLGGDTAAALASSNPVVVKGHPSHPATSSLFAKAMANAIEKCGFPIGTFSLLQGQSNELGGLLVANSGIKSVGFTGSVSGGRALMDIAAKRAAPITVYAEMGSINPVFIMPDSITNRAQDMATGLAASIAMGAGQFCTSPGLIVCLKSSFPELVATNLSQQPRGYMLNPGIGQAMASAVDKRIADGQITLLTPKMDDDSELMPSNTLMKISAQHFIQTPALLEEIFGPVSLVVECESMDELHQVSQAMEGNLTATIHTDDFENSDVKQLLKHLKTVAGRVLFNGFPTGVEVCQSMQHGGPYPASSMPASTSVGTAAITRFTSRQSFQNCPDSLLPMALKDNNPLGIWRHINNANTQASVEKQS